MGKFLPAVPNPNLLKAIDTIGNAAAQKAEMALAGERGKRALDYTQEFLWVIDRIKEADARLHELAEAEKLNERGRIVPEALTPERREELMKAVLEEIVKRGHGHEFNSDTFCHLCRIGTLEKNLEESVRILSILVEMGEVFCLACNNRAVAYYRLGRYEEAIADCTRAIETERDGDYEEYQLYYRNRGRAYCARGMHEQALVDFKVANALGARLLEAEIR